MAHKHTDKPVPKFTWDQIDAIREKAGLVFESCPADAFNARTYSEKFHLKYDTARSQLSQLVRDGALKSGKRWATGADGRRVSEACYWPAK